MPRYDVLMLKSLCKASEMPMACQLEHLGPQAALHYEIWKYQQSACLSTTKSQGALTVLHVLL